MEAKLQRFGGRVGALGIIVGFAGLAIRSWTTSPLWLLLVLLGLAWFGVGTGVFYALIVIRGSKSDTEVKQ